MNTKLQNREREAVEGEVTQENYPKEFRLAWKGRQVNQVICA